MMDTRAIKLAFNCLRYILHIKLDPTLTPPQLSHCTCVNTNSELQFFAWMIWNLERRNCTQQMQ